MGPGPSQIGGPGHPAGAIQPAGTLFSFPSAAPRAGVESEGDTLTIVATIEDLQRLASRRVPRMFYDLVDAGSYSEGTYRANEADLQRIKLRQRVAVDVGARNLKTCLLGEDVTMPVALAPAGLTGMQRADGEILAARAAERFGVPFTLSTMSVCSIEDVAAATHKPFWFQLYVMRDREFARSLIRRAKAAGCSALVLTLDLPMVGQRHKDVRNGRAYSKRTLVRFANLASKPRWCLEMLRTSRRSCGNIVGHAKGVSDETSMRAWVGTQFDPTVTWADVAWVRSLWDGPLVLKGILDAEDAQYAVNCGADALVVSNHGGRQLDGAPSSISVLPSIVDAVATRAEVWMDGGVRSGQDVFKACALGARGVMIGRSYLYGLGAEGEAGVGKCLDIIRRELDATLALSGTADIRKVGRDSLVAGSW
ncbi:alpha-hydroxy-acid oxidizing enzyme [Metapseudomonas resinovorans]|nr:alpha-hydroxy-acid oxidizing enzyme [Pseudomonas resinovorans]